MKQKQLYTEALGIVAAVCAVFMLANWRLNMVADGLSANAPKPQVQGEEIALVQEEEIADNGRRHGRSAPQRLYACRVKAIPSNAVLENNAAEDRPAGSPDDPAPGDREDCGAQAEAAEILAEAAEVSPTYFESIPLESGLQQALRNACAEFGVPYAMALGIIEKETDFSNQIGDSGASIGFFQIQPRWWGYLMAEIGTSDLTDPKQNFRTGCAILAYLLELYDGNELYALTAYNTGHAGVSAYAFAVLDNAEKWERALAA